MYHNEAVLGFFFLRTSLCSQVESLLLPGMSMVFRCCVGHGKELLFVYALELSSRVFGPESYCSLLGVGSMLEIESSLGTFI